MASVFPPLPSLPTSSYSVTVMLVLAGIVLVVVIVMVELSPASVRLSVQYVEPIGHTAALYRASAWLLV